MVSRSARATAQSVQLSQARNPCCSCVCHVETTVRSPWILRSVFGDFHLRDIFRNGKCNEYSCRRQTTSNCTVLYQGPRQVTSSYISMVLQYSTLDGHASNFAVVQSILAYCEQWESAWHTDAIRREKSIPSWNKPIRLKSFDIIGRTLESLIDSILARVRCRRHFAQ